MQSSFAYFTGPQFYHIYILFYIIPRWTNNKIRISLVVKTPIKNAYNTILKILL